jgi:2-polyprenyl-3-methyl-5-hydroxy-6-metoxy-1,4-benzoquinol methylase
MACIICNTEDFKLVLRKENLTLVRCQKCHLIYLNGLQSNLNIENYAYYNKRINMTKDELYNSITEKRYTALLKKIEAHRKNNEILDVGCGEGHFISVAKSMQWHITGIETTPYAVEICKKFGLNVMHSGLLGINLQRDYYDIVTMFEVLEHLESPKKYLNKINSILRRNGILIITTPNFNCLARLLLKERCNIIHKQHLCYFTPNTVKSLLKECNFKVIDLTVKNINLPVLWKFFKKDSIDWYGSNQVIRNRIETNRMLSFLKRILNKMLNLTKMGETIECICQKV